MTETTSLPISELRASIASGVVAAHEVVRHHRDQAAAMGLNAFTAFTHEDVRPSGPLRGIPVAIKDAFVDGGRAPTMGSRVHATWLSGTATILERLRDLGATVIGYTNMHEWGIGTTSTVTATGPVRNPWDPNLIAGGSSGGSAAAVAAGLVPIAIGTDSAGSVRVPAACCRIVGFKPTFGVLPLGGEAVSTGRLNTAGILSRNVADVAFLFGALSRRSGADAPVDQLTLGVPATFFFDDVDPRVVAVVERAAERLGASFGALREVPVAGVELAAAVVARWHLPHVAGLVTGALKADPDSFDPRTLKALRRGIELESEPDADATPVLAGWDEAFAVCDVVVVPTLPALPPPIDDPRVALPSGSRSADKAQIALNAPMNVAGLPAVSVPGGELDGIPVGVTLVGPAGSDEVVLAAAARLEDSLDGAFRDRVAPTGGTDD